MAKKKVKKAKKSMKCHIGDNCKGGCTYFLGFLGAAIYYISVAPSFWIGVLGVLKALIWPLFVVLELLKFLGA